MKYRALVELLQEGDEVRRTQKPKDDRHQMGIPDKLKCLPRHAKDDTSKRNIAESIGSDRIDCRRH
eukprot:COSAG06_NODE_11753_length_1468_cov_35.415632_1_plen_65_part_10